MEKPLRVAVLSDTHFTADPAARDSFCWNTVCCTQSLPALPRLAAKLRTLDLDLILHLGDFTNDGSIEACEAGMTGLRDVGVPVAVVRGNHDTGPVQQWLSEHQGQMDRTFVMKQVRFVLLDSCVRETELDPASGDKRKRVIRPGQLRWLEQVLKDDPKTLTVIASHFPLATSCFYPAGTDPDRQPVNGLSAEQIGRRIGYVGNREAVWSLLAQYPNVRLCLAGHWHMNEIISVAQTWCVISASTCEYPCQFRVLSFSPDAVSLETCPSGIDPLSSYIAANKNDFPLGKAEDRSCSLPAGYRR